MPRVNKPPSVKRAEAITRVLKVGLLDKGWTVAHLAELCGSDGPRISRIINHPQNVKLDTILNIAAKLGIDSIPTK